MKVSLFGTLRTVIGGITETQVHVTGACTAREALTQLTDTYPGRQAPEQILMLYQPSTGQLVELGRYLPDAKYQGDYRCDLHPRWSRDGRSICFDSCHDGSRQMYLIDVSSVT